MKPRREASTDLAKGAWNQPVPLGDEAPAEVAPVYLLS
jgi:hypothetical protein